jgi:hypothetical protein
MKGAQALVKPTRAMAFVPKLIAHSDLTKAKGRTHHARALKSVRSRSDTIKAPATSPATDDLDIEQLTGPTMGLTRAGHLEINLPVLLRTRMLITASSGGGKSYAMRRLTEQTAPLVQQIVIDSEGEFSTLTERFPFVVFNNRSKVPLSECSAYALAQEIVRKEVSAVVDISEFETLERDHFVSRFIHGLMKLPPETWRPVMVFLDEAHLFAPQQGKSEAKKAVSDLACRGRKRGYCAVMATNRLSLLSKSVASELQNRLIGQTGLDTDIKRAADELGMGRLHAISTLTNLDPGNFMVFGPALSKTVQRLAIGSVQTTHGVPLGEIKGPVTPTEQMLEEIFKLAEKKPEHPVQDDKAEGHNSPHADKSEHREDARRQIAQQRLRILAPILALPEDSPDRGAAITRAVEQSGLNRQTLYNWLNDYNPADPLGSLAPVRVPRNWQADNAATAVKKTRAPRKKVIRLKPGGRK